MIDYSQLREPVTEDDAVDQIEYMEVATETVKALFDRVRFQYQGDTWISNELWEVYLKMKEATDRFDRLRQTRCFPH